MSFTDFQTQLSTLVGAAFAAEGLDATLGAVKRSDRPDLGDYQCNGALPAAKKLGKNPREIADAIATTLAKNPLFKKVDVAGAGFINMMLTDDAIATHTATLADNKKAGVTPAAKRLKVLVDYGGPNSAKPMHVGHLRSAIIGDSVKRTARFLGHDVTGDIHIGDWGLQIGLVILMVQEKFPTLPHFRADYTDAMDTDVPVTMDDLNTMYPAASARMKEDEAFREKARVAVAELQKGRPGYLALHRHFNTISKTLMRREYQALGIEFDLWKGESDVQYLIEGIVDDFKKRGVAVLDDGAWVVHVKRNDDKGEMPPLLLVSSAESAMYGTTDVATIRERQNDIKADLYLYVVDQRQALHFQQVFRTAVKAGYGTDEQFEHIGFGTMNGTDGKPFKTRAGGVVKLHDLITTATEKAQERMKEAGIEGDATTALAIGTAALKFADLSNARLTNYIFDFDRFTSFEGKTGPYLQYQGVRIKSILRKAAEQNITDGTIILTLPEERALALHLDAFNAAVHMAFDKRAPHFIADHVYTLAQAFGTFYAAAPILPEQDAVKRASRLRLAKTTLAQLEKGLDLLGIIIPERM